jgi:dipeptidyl-peptidase-4
MILIACNSNQIFRHSFTADYYLYNIVTKELTKLFDFQVQNLLSLLMEKIAYAKENNLYVYDLAAKSTTQITDGKKMPSLMVLRTGFMKKNLLCKSI